MPRVKPPRKPHGLERWRGQEASQQYAVRVLTREELRLMLPEELQRLTDEELDQMLPEEWKRLYADEALARTLPEELQPTLCNLAGLRLGSKEATVMLAEVARVLALLPGLPEALAPGAATVAVALRGTVKGVPGGVEGLAHQLRVALGNLDPRSRALLERRYAGSALKLDLVQARKLLLTLEGHAHDASRQLRGKGRGRPAPRDQQFIAVALARVFSKRAVAGDRKAGTMARARLDFVAAALQPAGVEYSDSELRHLLATPRVVKP